MKVKFSFCFSCELWAKFVFPDGPWHSPEFHKKLFSEHRMLCSKHFDLTSFSDFSQKKLFRDASPKENCVEVGVKIFMLLKKFILTNRLTDS